MKIRIKRFLLCCSYNPNKNQITKHLAVISKNLDTFSSKYDNFILIGDLNSEPCEQPPKDLCQICVMSINVKTLPITTHA